jgi:cytochrome c-type biogenesis protein
VTDVSFLAAFIGGVFSFISPCVLPLVPGYISFISGVSFDDMKGTKDAKGAKDTKEATARRRKLLFASLAFVAGLSVVFIAFGASATMLAKTLGRNKALLEKIAGVVVIVLGLHLANIFRIKWLDMDTRRQTGAQPAGLFGAFIVGVAFAFGWTPCIGPILGGILVLAGSRETVSEGILMLAVYSAGLGVPFVLTALAMDRFFLASARIRKQYQKIERVSGGLLILLGILILTNQFSIIVRSLDRWFPWLTKLS